MTKLQHIGRPWAVFDAHNVEHRRAFAEFQRTRTWGHSPVRFILSEASSNLVTQIQRELIQYYVDQEFKQ